MEEDIKILEDFIKYFEAEAISIKYRRNISITVGEDDIQALENLIKGYRELETQNKTLTDEYMIQKHLINADFLNNYIPKSKIKEKIKELYEDKDSKYYDMFLEQRDIEKTISVLQELMEDK